MLRTKIISVLTVRNCLPEGYFATHANNIQHYNCASLKNAKLFILKAMYILSPDFYAKQSKPKDGHSHTTLPFFEVAAFQNHAGTRKSGEHRIEIKIYTLRATWY